MPDRAGARPGASDERPEATRRSDVKVAMSGEPGTMRAGTDTAYRVEGLWFRYVMTKRTDDAEWVLRDLALDVRSGEVVGILGPNGSGKTSLLKILAKLLQPERGEVHLFGRCLAELPQDAVARLVGVVPQDSQQIFPFTIEETVLMGRFPHQRGSGWRGFGWDSPVDRRLAGRAMEELDVAHLGDRLISDVSGGERQRALIARALTQEPQALLLDEPTAFLDLHHQVDICRIVRRLCQERQLTVLMASHDLNMASQYCDRLVLLDRGRIVLVGRPEEVLSPEVLREVYGCEVLIDRHPVSGRPRVTLPGYEKQ